MTALPDVVLGPAAGVATSVLWAVTSVLFTEAGRRIGPTLVNATRLGLAVVLLGLTFRVLSGSWFPTLLPAQVWALALSGVLGLSVCDQCLFTAFVDIGPRRALLVMTTSPLFALAFGALFLGEHVAPLAYVGIALTLTGVLWVLLERSGRETTRWPREHLVRGVLLALVAAALQAAGAWLGKRGLGHGLLPPDERLSPQAGTYVRIVWGALGMLPVLAFLHLRRGRRAAARASPSERRAGLGFAALGAVFGPYLGVWASLIAFDLAPIGIAQTLCSLAPVLILPFVGRLYGEHVGLRALLGAAIAIGGSALLFVG